MDGRLKTLTLQPLCKLLYCRSYCLSKTEHLVLNEKCRSFWFTLNFHIFMPKILEWNLPYWPIEIGG